ncbi:VanW family protein [Nocardioides sp.]|uniref:VanW family protein n=1 Tax=Nocardioides sp. TaxID=35761 RepID=UPI003D125F7A
MTTTPSPRDDNGGRVVLVLILVLVALFGGGYVAAYALAGDKLPRGTTVAGVEVGGRTPAEAEQLLRDALADRESEPIAVTVGTKTTPITPDEAGISVDYAASVAGAGGGGSWSPQYLWDYWTGGSDLDPVIEFDEGELAATLDRLETRGGTAPVDGTVSFVAGRVRTTAAADGEGIDPATAQDAIAAAFVSGESALTLELEPMAPEIDDDDVQSALDDFANPAVSGPVTLVFDDSPVRILPAEYSRVLSMKADDGVLVPALDTARLAKLVDRRTVARGEPVDATVRLVNGRPKVIPAKPGVQYDEQDISAAFLDVVVKDPGERQLKVKASVAEPEFTTKDAKALKIRRKVSTFTTYYPYAEYRNINIGRAAELVNGTVLKPGETFSLNRTVGERTRENGFTEGFIISNGIFAEDLGGGVSQMATTTFNAMFFAGLKDIEHKPHSFYIDRYPVGREATVAWGSVDLRFKNDTPYGILIQANVTPATAATQGVVTVSMWSTKVWDITSSTSARYAYTPPATRTLTTADCYPNTGYSGFQVDVTRFFRKVGESKLDHKEVFHTVYTPSDTVICKPPPSPSPSPSGQ